MKILTVLILTCFLASHAVAGISGGGGNDRNQDILETAKEVISNTNISPERAQFLKPILDRLEPKLKAIDDKIRSHTPHLLGISPSNLESQRKLFCTRPVEAICSDEDIHFVAHSLISKMSAAIENDAINYLLKRQNLYGDKVELLTAGAMERMMGGAPFEFQKMTRNNSAVALERELMTEDLPGLSLSEIENLFNTLKVKALALVERLNQDRLPQKSQLKTRIATLVRETMRSRLQQDPIKLVTQELNQDEAEHLFSKNTDPCECFTPHPITSLADRSYYNRDSIYLCPSALLRGVPLYTIGLKPAYGVLFDLAHEMAHAFDGVSLSALELPLSFPTSIDENKKESQADIIGAYLMALALKELKLNAAQNFAIIKNDLVRFCQNAPSENGYLSGHERLKAISQSKYIKQTVSCSLP